MVDKSEHSNQLVVNETAVEAEPDEVWELLATEEGRDAWLEPDPERTILVESEQEPERISWWWWTGDEAPRHVELWVVPNDTHTRVIAIESAPALPIEMLAQARAWV
ncbi:MAG: hypothetical protein J2O48_11865 [Solirubrobacterales bacterium]|nr:hypothetical protein [Solirubrobacterales bacterium]